MKFLILTISLLSFQCISQTGDLICDVTFSWEDFSDEDQVDVKLISKDDTLIFNQITVNDTLRHIQPGTYDVYLNDFDLEHAYTGIVKIRPNQITILDYHGTLDIDYRDRPESDTSNLKFDFYNGGYQFGAGMISLENSQTSNYSFNMSMFLGGDLRLGSSPFAIGMEGKFEYNHTSFTKTDFNDPSITYRDQRVSNINFGASAHLSLYIKNSKLMDLGVAYHLPIRARFIQSEGSQINTTRWIHNYNDVRLLARVGYGVVMAYAEYRPVKFMKSPHYVIPKVSIGIRFNIPAFDYY